jgi:hypothetical protein
LLALGLHSLADMVTWLLLVAVISGAVRLGMFLYQLPMVNRSACLIVPALGFATAALYRLVVVRVAPALWPSSDATLVFAIIAFALVALGFAAETGLLAFHGSSGLRRWMPIAGPHVMLAYTQVVVTVVGLLWFAVALR